MAQTSSLLLLELAVTSIVLHVMASAETNRADTGIIKCACSDKRSKYCQNGTCSAKYCYSLLEKYKAIYKFGCFKTRIFWAQCFHQDVQDNMLTCCNSSSFCNKNLMPFAIPTTQPRRFDNDAYTTQGGQDNSKTSTVTLVLSSMAAVGFIVLMVLLFASCHRFKRSERNVTQERVSFQSGGSRALHSIQSTSTELNTIDDSGMSSKGGNLLSTRRVFHELNWKRPIGQGSFGQVWLCSWQGKEVAVKQCCTRSKTWENEAAIYKTAFLRHPNILTYFADDVYDNDGSLLSIVITEYHSYGTLFDFLSKNVLSVDELLHLAQSTVDGIQYLHTNIIAFSSSKPSIAHRDINSKNILVKSNGEACVADLGLAITSSMHQELIGQGSAINIVVGTRRHMAPEILSGTLATHMFSAFLMADIYSLSLVLWELLSRCKFNGEEVGGYIQPYSEHVQQNPSKEEMTKVVVTHQLRPTIKSTWKEAKIGNEFSSMLTTCWKGTPESRLTALRLSKNFVALREKFIAYPVSTSHESSGYNSAESASSETSHQTAAASTSRDFETSL